MKTRKAVRTSSGGDKTRDFRSVRRFLEEFSWLLAANSQLDFRAILDVIDAVPDSHANRSLGNYASKNPNIHFLIGALPVIFSDETIFPTNEDLVGFSDGALNLPIPRWEKRSRYELIGLIVCETAKLDDNRLHRLVKALTKIIANDPNAQDLFKNRKGTRLNWNEVIQRLTGD
jgi:hypothetical protein